MYWFINKQKLYLEWNYTNLKLDLDITKKDLLFLESKQSWGKCKWVDDSFLNDYFSAMAESVDKNGILFWDRRSHY